MNSKSLQRVGLVVLTATMAVILGPRSAYAHIGVSPAHDLLHGLQHPLTGVDHLLAMFSVGLWAAQRGGRSLWFVPLTFISVMAVGTFLGVSGVAIPWVEPVVEVSVLFLGLFVAAALKLPVSVTAAVVGIFALFHGHTHGAEIPASTSALTYAMGLILATAFLHATGICLFLLMQRLHFSRFVQYAGAAIAVCGVLFCIR
jgi:urease accessory protein